MPTSSRVCAAALRVTPSRPSACPVPGKVDIPYLIKAFETGADGVVIVTCKKNECRHFEGNLRAHKRAEAVESLLEEIGMSAGRMAVVECENRAASNGSSAKSSNLSNG